MSSRRRSVRGLGAIAVVLASILAGCAPGEGPGAPTNGPALSVYAASSLRAALDEAKALYEAGHRGATLSISTDSSAALEAKIEQAAPADVFLSADSANPEKLVNAGFAVGAPKPFATNELAIIVPKGNPAQITSPFDLARPGVKIIAAGDSVPIARYAAQLVQNVAKLPGAPAGFERAYAANVVTKAENVAAVVTQIELGEGDAAIVYLTDAKASTKVDTVAISPDSANVVATYAGVVVRQSTQPTNAQAFLDWLAGPQGQAVLQGFGFLPPPP